MGAGSDAGEPDSGSALNQAQASLLDLADGGDAGASQAPVPAPTAAAGGFSGLDDLMSLGGGGGSGAAAAAPAPVPATAAPSPADLLGGLMGGSASPTPAAAAPAAPAGGLGGLEDLLGGLGGGGGGAAAAPAAPSVSLVPQPQLSPQEFQAKWQAWTPQARSFQQQLQGGAVGSVEANGFRVSAQGVPAVQRAWLAPAAWSGCRPATGACRTAGAGRQGSSGAALCGAHGAPPAPPLLPRSRPRPARTSPRTSGRRTWRALRRRARAARRPTASCSTRRRRAAARTCWCRRAAVSGWVQGRGKRGRWFGWSTPVHAGCGAVHTLPRVLVALSCCTHSPPPPLPPPAPALEQVTVSKSPAAAAVVVKSDDAAAAAHVEELLQTLLLTL